MTQVEVADSAPSCVEVEVNGGIVLLRLNDPPARNALSEDTAEELRQALRHHSATARVFILTGAGEGFCAGAKLSGQKAKVDPAERDLGAPLRDYYNPLMLEIRNLSVPLIVAVNGAAAGVGSSLALSGDIIIASENAFFLQAFSRIGLAPDGGATYLLTKSVGRVRAMEMVLLDERMSAAQALDWGLINRVVPADQLMNTVLEMAEKIASGPTAAYAAIRKLVWQACEGGYEDHLGSEADLQTVLGRSRDHQEGVRAFLTREKPSFVGQ